MKRLEAFGFNKSWVRYINIIIQRREAEEPGIGVWQPI